MSVQGESAHATRLTFRLLARWFPYHPPRDKAHLTLAELKPQFKKWDLITLLILFACAPFTTWACKVGLDAGFPPPPAPAGALQHITIDPVFFLLPALFLGLILAAVPVMGLLRLLLGKRFSDYLHYGNLLVGFDSVKIWFAFATVLFLGSLGVASASGGAHLTVFNDRIELQDFGHSKPVVIPAAQIISAVTSDTVSLKLSFRDGTTWSSADGLSLLTPSHEQARAIAAHFPAGR